MYLINRIITIVIFIIFASCSQITTKIEPGKNYKLDISMSNKPSGDQYFGEGMLVLPKKSLYTILFETESKISLISFRTCSREVIAEDPSVGLNRKKYQINYSPNEIERAEACPTVVSAFSDTGLYSVGYIDYEDDNTTLPAENICGGKVEKTRGVSVCQERVSSIERIRFDTEVITSPDPGCELQNNRGKEFTYKIKGNYCIYAFMEVASPNRIHRLTTYGYNDVLIRR